MYCIFSSLHVQCTLLHFNNLTSCIICFTFRNYGNGDGSRKSEDDDDGEGFRDLCRCLDTLEEDPAGNIVISIFICDD